MSATVAGISFAASLLDRLSLVLPLNHLSDASSNALAQRLRRTFFRTS